MEPKDKIDLNVPYTALPKLNADGDPSVEETPVQKEEESTIVEPVEETKVPYSRFKNVHSRATEAEKEAAYWRDRYESFQEPAPRHTEPSETPEYWKKLYGDSPAAIEGWKIQERANQEVRESARREALESVRNERYETAARIEENVDTIDENLDQLSAFVGRDLTEREQSAVLDIVDEYTPQDSFGNYLGAVLPFEKAWEIYELKNNAQKAPQRQSRDAVATLTSQRTQGETDITEKDKHWNPRDWTSYKKRL